MSRYLYNSVDVRCIENLVGKNIFKQLLTKILTIKKTKKAESEYALLIQLQCK